MNFHSEEILQTRNTREQSSSALVVCYQVFVYLCICVFLYLCICVSVYLCICACYQEELEVLVCSSSSPVSTSTRRSTWEPRPTRSPHKRSWQKTVWRCSSTPSCTTRSPTLQGRWRTWTTTAGQRDCWLPRRWGTCWERRTSGTSSPRESLSPTKCRKFFFFKLKFFKIFKKISKFSKSSPRESLSPMKCRKFF